MKPNELIEERPDPLAVLQAQTQDVSLTPVAALLESTEED